MSELPAEGARPPRGRPVSQEAVPDLTQGQQNLTPIPDPTTLTDTAISRATEQFRRELDGLRELLAERIQTEIESRDQSVAALRDLFTRRMDDLDQQIARRFGLADQLPGQIAESRKVEMLALRELIEARLAAMDKATELVADNLSKQIAAGEASGDRYRAEFVAGDLAVREMLTGRLDAMDKTIELLARSVDAVPADIEKSATGLKEVIETRLAGMDEATKLLATNVDKVPYAILQEAGNLKALIMSKIDDVAHVGDEKFKAVESTFESNALALTAALAAQEKAVAEQNKSNTLAITKSEVTTKETIAANAQQFQTAQRSLESAIVDLKERVVRIESTGAGISSVTGTGFDAASYRQFEDANKSAAVRAQISMVIAAVAVLATIISLVLYATKKG